MRIRRPDGTGLGLQISCASVQRYAGGIRATNRSNGRGGAVFTVNLRVVG